MSIHNLYVRCDVYVCPLIYLLTFAYAMRKQFSISFNRSACKRWLRTIYVQRCEVIDTEIPIHWQQSHLFIIYIRFADKISEWHKYTKRPTLTTLDVIRNSCFCVKFYVILHETWMNRCCKLNKTHTLSLSVWILCASFFVFAWAYV